MAKAAFRVKYDWRSTWESDSDVIVAKDAEDARKKALKRLANMRIDGKKVGEVRISETTKVLDVTL